MTDGGGSGAPGDAGSAGGARGEEFRVKSRGALPADEVRALSRLDPVRATWSLLQTFALVAACAAVAVRWPHPLVVAAAIVGMVAAQHQLAVLAHEAAHYRIYQRRWLNDLAGRLCAAPLGLSMLTYRVIHRIHHNHLYEPIDPDLPLMAGYPRGRAYLAGKLAKDLFGLTTVKNYAYFVGKPAGRTTDNGRPLDDTSPSLRAAAARDRKLAFAIGVVLLAASIAFGWWRWYLVLWILPLVTLLQAILRLRAVLEHGAVDDVTTPLRAARTNLVPWWCAWLLFPHHVGYHIEHHLYPSIPHYRLRECHRRLGAAGLLDGAEVATVGAALGKVFAPPRAARA